MTQYIRERKRVFLDSGKDSVYALRALTAPLNCGWTNYESDNEKFIDPRVHGTTNEASRAGGDERERPLRRRSRVRAAAAASGEERWWLTRASVEAVCTNGRPANSLRDATDLRLDGIVLTGAKRRCNGAVADDAGPSRADQGRRGYNEFDHRVGRKRKSRRRISKSRISRANW